MKTLSRYRVARAIVGHPWSGVQDGLLLASVMIAYAAGIGVRPLQFCRAAHPTSA